MTQALNLEQIRAKYLRDLQNQNPAAHVHAGSDNHVRATALAALAEGQYQHQEWVLRQAFADTADSEFLEKHAAQYGLFRKLPTLAAGKVRISGNTGAAIPAGLSVRETQSAYIVTQGGTVGSDGTVDLPVVSLSSGNRHNRDGEIIATLKSPPAGIDATVLLLGIYGGTDGENDDSLRNRLLMRLRHPPAGGNAHDYYQWAMEVPGVERAFVYPLRRGLGTVDIAVVTRSGLPSEEVLATAQAYIDERRPVTAKNCLVLAPVLLPVVVRAKIKVAPGYSMESIKQALGAQLKTYFAGIQPGGVVYRSHLELMISQMPGVIDRVLELPSANTAATVLPTLQWPALGQIELNPL